MTKIHLIADESIGGIKREYIEVERKAAVGDYVHITFFEGKRVSEIRKVKRMSSVYPGDFTFEPQLNGESYFDFERGEEYSVLIPANSAPTEPTPDLATRVTALERIVGELVRSKSSVESQLNDAMRNIERQAQELETEKKKVSDLKDEVESNTKDIAFLDDRTYEKTGKPTKYVESLTITEFAVTPYSHGVTDVELSFIGSPTVENISEAILKVMGGGAGA